MTRKKKAAKKKATKKKSPAKKNGAGKRVAPPFKKGNQIGKETRFKKGNPGGPGRPPKWESPRDMIRYWMAIPLSEKRKKEIRAEFPDMPEDATDRMLTAGHCALRLVQAGFAGDIKALQELIKQVDDLGVDKSKVEHEGGVHIYIPDNGRK